MGARDLLYAVEPGLDALVFVPREIVEEILMARERLREPMTWGEARAIFSPRLFEELLDVLVEPLDERTPGPPPPDDQELEFWEEYQGHDREWPALAYYEILGWLPEEIIDEYGEPYDSMAYSGVHMPASREREIVEAIRAAGISCEKDDRIVTEELFDYEI
jgi:hypothetical protein